MHATSYKVLFDRQSILEHSDALLELARDVNQEGAMNWLTYFWDESKLKRKRPVLVIAEHDSPTATKKIWAAATFVEYTILGASSGFFCSDDSVGFRSVVAPAARRAEFTVGASTALFQHGASMVLAAVESPAGEVDAQAAQMSGARYAVKGRQVERFLPLAATMDAMLASFGKRTRINLRYYRRRLESEVGCVFDGELRDTISLEQMKELNRVALNPVAEDEIELRYRVLRADASSFCVGLRTLDGTWLSLAGGWHQGTRAVLHWQANIAGHEKRSIGTVMRSYFLEHLIELGMKSLFLYGGMPHTMQHAFTADTITTLLLDRGGLRSGALRRAAALAYRFESTPGQIAFLAEVFGDPELRWKVTGTGTSTTPLFYRVGGWRRPFERRPAWKRNS